MRQKYPSLFDTCDRLCLTLAAALFLLLAAAPSARASAILSTRATLAVQPAEAGGATLSATVTTALGDPVTGGTVDFVLANGQSLGSAQVSAGGVATLTVAKLPPATGTSLAGGGQLAVAAQFHPTTADYTASVSPATAVASPEATTAPPDFSFTANPTTLTVAQGSYGTSLLTVTSLGGFAGPVQFSCSDLPAQVTCVFNPTQQSLAANGSVTTTLQLQTQASSGTASSAIERHSRLALACAFPGALALFGLARRRRFRSMQWLAIAFLLTGATLGLSGCSPRYNYFHHGPTVATGTPAGTYTINVVADGDQVSSVIEHTLTISLVVQ